MGMSAPLRKPKADPRPLPDGARERYTYDLGDGNYLVLEEVDARQGIRQGSNSLYVRGKGASDDMSTLVIDNFREGTAEAADQRARALDYLSTPAIKPRSNLKERSTVTGRGKSGSHYRSPGRGQSLEKSVRFETGVLEGFQPPPLRPLPQPFNSGIPGPLATEYDRRWRKEYTSLKVPRKPTVMEWFEEDELAKGIYEIMQAEMDLETTKRNLALQSDFNVSDCFKMFDLSNTGLVTRLQFEEVYNMLELFP